MPLDKILLDILACPECPGDETLTLTNVVSDGIRVMEGTLHCGGCDRSWPVRAGIPRFVASVEDYAGNFGFQWRRWRTVQIDRLGGHTLSEDRLLNDTGWARDWWATKWRGLQPKREDRWSWYRGARMTMFLSWRSTAPIWRCSSRG